MAEYYLISQLPSLDGISENAPVPVTEERFLELCSRSVGKRVMNELKNLSLLPSVCPVKSTSTLVENWNCGERNLRLALAKCRADKMNKAFDVPNGALSVEMMKVARSAVEIENPLEAENFLSRYRLDFLESLRPMDNFSDDFIFYYGIKLKLILRIRELDKELGKATYRNIYNSILDGDRLEEIL